MKEKFAPFLIKDQFSTLMFEAQDGQNSEKF